MTEVRGACFVGANGGATATPLELGAQQRRRTSLPFRISVWVGPCQRRHSVTENDVGIVKDLLHLHGPVGAPANIVSCDRKVVVRPGQMSEPPRWGFRHLM